MQLDLFRGVVPFVAVAEESSFRKAATRLGVSPAAVSKAIQTLEAELGLTLFARTSRTVALTRAGETFFERCRPAVAALQGAREAVEAARRAPQGELVVSAPVVVMPLLVPGLGLLRAKHPGLTFSVKVTDQLSRLAEESVDVAVRVGALRESALVARRLRATRLLTVASPAYLARRGTPADLDALAQHDCLVLLGVGGKPRPWVFASGVLPVPAVMLVDHGPTLVEAALAGLGVAQAFDYMVEAQLRSGRLVELCAAHAGPGPDIHAVCTPGRRASANVRAAFHAFADAFAPAR